MISITTAFMTEQRDLPILVTEMEKLKTSSLVSDPPSHLRLVADPPFVKISLQPLLLSPYEEIDERYMNGGDHKRTWASKQHCSSEEDKYISTEIERIPREAVEPGRNRALCGASESTVI